MASVAISDEWEKPFLLHLGLHKCASTWLQKLLFSDEASGFYAPFGAMASMAVTEFVTVDPLLFDFEKTRENLAAATSSLHRTNMMTVISHEALSSRPHHGRYYAPIVARRLHAVFPNARVLLIFREQVAMIYALYVEHVRNGGTHTLQEFVGTGNEPPGWEPLCKLSFFQYHRLFDAYCEEFGPENVLILPLELLQTNPQDFQGRILNFCNLPARTIGITRRSNVSWSPLATEACRKFNRVVRRNPLGPKQPASYNFAQRTVRGMDRLTPNSWARRRTAQEKSWISTRIGHTFVESNNKLAEASGFDLKQLGYNIG